MVGVDLACFVALWYIGRRCFWCMASILARYLLSKKIKICTLIVVYFWFSGKKRLKVSSLKMAKKWFENLVMEIILFNTKNNRVPKIRLLRVVKKSGLRLERANLADFL